MAPAPVGGAGGRILQKASAPGRENAEAGRLPPTVGRGHGGGVAGAPRVGPLALEVAVTSLCAALSLWAAAGTPPKPKFDIKIEKPKIDVEMPDLGGVPKADGLTAGTESAQGPELKATGGGEIGRKGDVVIEKVVHAVNFAAHGNARVPRGAISEFNVYALPARIDPFKTRLTLSSPDGMTTPILVALRSPGGEALMSSRGEVVFEQPGRLDFVIDWSAFEARAPGDYKVTVQIGVQKSQDFVLPIKLAK